MLRIAWGDTVSNAKNGAARRLPYLRRLATTFPISVLTSLSFVPFDRAVAQDSVQIEQITTSSLAGRPAKESQPDALAPGPLFAVVSIADQRISIYGSSGLMARSPVSTGMRGYSTPTGVFSIVQKKRYHESNIYSGAPMPFMQRITWSGIALHAGVVPGHPASHGCIRLPASFAPRLFKATEIGQRVIVAPTDIAPIDVIHANLPTPKLLPAPGVASAPETPETPDAIVSISSRERTGAMALEPAGFHDVRALTAPPSPLNPLEFARAMKTEATFKAKAAAGDTRAAIVLMGKKTTDLRIAARKLSAAEDAAAEAAGELRAAVRRLEKAGSDEPVVEAAEGVSEAEADLAEAHKAKDARIAKAAEALNRADAALAEAQKAAEEARAAKAAEVKAVADAALAEIPQPEDAALSGSAEASLAQMQKAAEARAAKAASARSKAEAALAEAQKTGDARIARATRAKSEAEEDLAEARQAGEARVAKAIEAKADAEAGLAEAHKDRELRIAKATEAKSQAEAAVSEAQKAAEEARAARDARQDELTAAKTAVDDARAAGKAASQALSEASRRMKPLSVFISRKTGRLYVRQNFEPLFDAPVTIRDAERDLGTHIYVSTRAAEDGSVLHWQAVSMPPIPPAPPAREGKRPRKGEAPIAATPIPALPPETAYGALDRVTIPEETVARLAELAWVGASVIVSDYGMSGETGATTDFIILTRGQPGRR